VLKIPVFCLILILIVHTNVLADQVILNNGDRLTGKIVKKDGDFVVVETEAAGTIKIKWASVEKIISDEPLVLTLADGNVMQGTIETEEDKLHIKASETETITIERKALKIVRTPEEQAKYEIEQKRLRERKLTDFWSGTIDAGFSLTAGNSDTRTFTAGLRGVRETPNNKFTAYANALQVRNSSGGAHKITAQSVWSGARYDVNVNKNWFGFASGDFEYNKPQKLNLRAVLGGGAGYHAVQRDRIKLDLTAGVTNNYENFAGGEKRNSAEFLLGEEAKIKLHERARLNNRIVFYPNISRFGDFRALMDASLQTDINSWLGWHLTVGNRYNSRPVQQTEKNDFLMSTGLRVSFGKNKKK
jgi:putative salt-induced outer membrane protein YdiY/preprotein translocase subunit YajC